MTSSLLHELQEIETDLHGKIRVSPSSLRFTFLAKLNSKAGTVILALFPFGLFIVMMLFFVFIATELKGKIIAGGYLLLFLGLGWFLFNRTSEIDFMAKELIIRLGGIDIRRIPIDNITGIHKTERLMSGIYIATIISAIDLRGKKRGLIVIRKHKNVARFTIALTRILQELNPKFLQA